MSRMDLYSDFREFFNVPANKKAVYKPKPGAVFKEAHAVVLVGYDNDKGYWIAKNSWGQQWADGGLFRVSWVGWAALESTWTLAALESNDLLESSLEQHLNAMVCLSQSLGSMGQRWAYDSRRVLISIA